MGKRMADQNKASLRRFYGSLRAKMPRSQAQQLSIAVERRALELACYRAAAAVALYAPIGNEVATELIARETLRSGRRLFYPQIAVQAGAMRMVEVKDPDALRPGLLGVAQPQGGEELPANLLPETVIFLPGVAFDPEGRRLGRGGAYYDRFLTSADRRLAAVGLAYSWQLARELPEQEWDCRVDYIVTELSASAVGASGEKTG